MSIRPRPSPAPSSDTVTLGAAFNSTVTTTRTPVPTLIESGAPLAGAKFKVNTDGSATISGTPTT
ncbi:MAG TPA: hypothetical protein VFC03_14515 [Acidimicrobiales bacterium]|nr:hypothetical protein [Acidimicrobiales bacterium]